MSKLTKAQLRVIELLNNGIQIRQVGSEWMHGQVDEGNKRFADKTICAMDLLNLIEPFPRSMYGKSGHRYLRLTEAGRQLAQERARKDSDD